MSQESPENQYDAQPLFDENTERNRYKKCLLSETEVTHFWITNNVNSGELDKELCKIIALIPNCILSTILAGRIKSIP